MRCAICGDKIEASNAPVLPTTDDQQVHLMCAERDAYRAAQRRTVGATFTAVLFAGLFVVAVLAKAVLYWIVAQALLLALIHTRINRRWWYYKIQSVRRWLRLSV